jgi:hypothetical protein
LIRCAIGIVIPRINTLIIIHAIILAQLVLM